VIKANGLGTITDFYGLWVLFRTNLSIHTKRYKENIIVIRYNE